VQRIHYDTREREILASLYMHTCKKLQVVSFVNVVYAISLVVYDLQLKLSKFYNSHLEIQVIRQKDMSSFLISCTLADKTKILENVWLFECCCHGANWTIRHYFWQLLPMLQTNFVPKFP